ncbi:MAG: hypothetical protein JWQ40_2599 [Segetibacter sp.]|jgi:hypothetical protein|nr:hypothetical protein [Segetibacter sp.]
MKFLYLILANGCLFANDTTAQETLKFTVPAGESISSILADTIIFKHPNFVYGGVYFKNREVSNALLNYNLLLGEIQFIDQKGDTLSLADENNIKYITVGKDSFFYSKGFIQLVTANDAVKLGVIEKLTLADKKKIGAYNQPTTRSSTRSYSSVSINNQRSLLSMSEEMVFTKERKYYLGDRFSKFLELNKKNLYKMFSANYTEIESYLKENAIDFNKKDDVIKLSSFLQRYSK